MLPSSRILGLNAVWNIIGRVAPMMVAVLLTPTLLQRLGPNRWGVFTLALSFIGVFGIFDFGIGRGLTRTVAEQIASGEEHRAACVVKSGIVVLTSFGLLGGLVMAFFIGQWTRSTLKVPAELHADVRAALYLLCAAVPLIVLNGGLWGVLAAYQRLRAANLASMPLMVMYYVGPLIAFHFSKSLVSVIGTVVGCRVVMTIAYAYLCLKVMPSLRSASVDFAALRPVLRLSGWMTVSNLVWPVLTYIDRLVIASFVSAAATGYYATPGDLAGRLHLIPASIMNTAFPAIAASYSINPANTANIVRRSMLSATTILFPVSLVTVSFSNLILTIWLGSSFASHSAPLLSWFAFGVLLSSADMVAAGFVDAIGYPSVNAKFSIVELFLYVPVLALFVKIFGLEGAAMTWVIRVLTDLLVRMYLMCRLYPQVRSALWQASCGVFTASGLLWLPTFAETLPLKVFAIIASLLLYLSALWCGSMTAFERSFTRSQALRALVWVRLLSQRASLPQA